MTLEIVQGITNYNLYINTPSLAPSAYYLEVKSKMSNKLIFPVKDLTWVSSNARYTHFTFELAATEGDLHLNGMHDYFVYSDVGLTTLVNSGPFKCIYNPGGTTGTTAYISNNENREADIFYRPSY